MLLSHECLAIYKFTSFCTQSSKPEQQLSNNNSHQKFLNLGLTIPFLINSERIQSVLIFIISRTNIVNLKVFFTALNKDISVRTTKKSCINLLWFHFSCVVSSQTKPRAMLHAARVALAACLSAPALFTVQIVLLAGESTACLSLSYSVTIGTPRSFGRATLQLFSVCFGNPLLHPSEQGKVPQLSRKALKPSNQLLSIG